MELVAEFEIHCEVLPLVEVAAAVPETTVILDLQFNHGGRPLFIATLTDGSQTAIEEALTDAFDVGEWTLIGQTGETRRYQMSPALDFELNTGAKPPSLRSTAVRAS